MDERFDMARDFARAAGWGNADFAPLAGDASARRYFRLTRGSESAVLMDAPAGDGQDIVPFVAIARVLQGLGLSAPQILASDQQHGFLLLEDLGDALFSSVITNDPMMEQHLYCAATDVLVALDQSPVPEGVGTFDPTLMTRQVAPFFEWYLDGGSDAAVNRFFAKLETVLTRTKGDRATLLLRDFHVENLIWLPGRTGLARVGLLDFQDAMAGSPGYDLVSLLLDARRDVSPGVVSGMIRRFADGTGRSPDSISESFAAIGVQRNLRILGVFARLARLHQKPRYLAFQPLVRRHVLTCLAHPALEDLRATLCDVWPEMDSL